MQKAAFSIKNYQFDKIKIDLEQVNGNELNIDFKTTGIYHNKANSFELVFWVYVNQKEDSPFISIRCKGLFEFDAVSSFDDIPDFFFRNSIAILFPYVRAYLSLVTTQANIPGIILPTLNLSHLEKELRENTTITE